MKEYKALKPFIAFGKAPSVGEMVWLNDEQADALMAEGCVAYETKVEPPPDPKPEAAREQGQPQPSSQPAQASRKRTLRRRIKGLISR